MSSTNGKCLSCGAVELGSILEHKKDCQVFPHTKDKTYRESLDKAVRETADYLYKIEGEKYLNASEVLNEYLDSKDSNDQKVYMDGYLEWLKDRIKQLKDKGGK